MAKVQDVARFFIDLAQAQAAHAMGDKTTNLRLQKLLYFAQGRYMARYGKPLFQADMAAWEYGPVVPEVYRAYKEFGSDGISEMEPVSMNAFTAEEYALLLDVARYYGTYATGELVHQSHVEGGPWAQVRERPEDGEIIPKEAIRAYFSTLPPIASFQQDTLPQYETIVPARDENGIVVLPAEMAEDWDEVTD